MKEPVLYSLNNLYDRIVRGYIIVFDEYNIRQWGESDTVDEFLKNHPELELKTLQWAKYPSAYIIKK